MRLTPDLLMQGYATGIFPMAEHRDDPEIFWVDPLRRGVMPLDGFHLSRSLRREMRNTQSYVQIDQDFAAVVDACADRAETWINSEIRRLYLTLHQRNKAHSLEIWEDGILIGGVYGVVLGAVAGAPGGGRVGGWGLPGVDWGSLGRGEGRGSDEE